jgi:hypothetical protein
MLLAGCGGQKANLPRVPNPVESTVKVGNNEVVVSPSRLDFGTGEGLTVPQSAVEAQAEEAGKKITVPTQEPPPTKADQPIVFTIANISDKDVSLVIRGPRSALSSEIPAGETGRLKVALPTGHYTVSAAGLTDARPGTLDIGPERTSAQNDLLLP